MCITSLLAGLLLSMPGSGVVNVTAEPVARGLHATPDHVQWTISYYLLAVGAGLVIG